MSFQIRLSAYKAAAKGDTSQLYFETTTRKGRSFYTLKNQSKWAAPLCVRNFFRGLIGREKHFTWNELEVCLADSQGHPLIADKVRDFLPNSDFRRFRKITQLRSKGEKKRATRLQLLAKLSILTKGAALAREQGYPPRIMGSHYYAEALAGERPIFMKYLNEQEREKYEVQIVHGKLTKSGKPYRTSKCCGCLRNDHIFVLAPDCRLYIAQNKYDTFHHSSFLSGGAVISAGEIQTDEDGTITAITDSSGHYLPGKQEMRNALYFLKARGCDLSQITVAEFGPQGWQHHANADQYLEQAEKLLA